MWPCVQILNCVLVFSSPVRKYRKSYCSHPGVGVGVSVGISVSVGVAQNVKVFGLSFYKAISLEHIDGLS